MPGRASVNGMVSVISGLFLIFSPGSGAIAIVWLIAAWAIVSGVMLLALAVRLPSRAERSSSVGMGA